jgi:hypothetical protein
MIKTAIAAAAAGLVLMSGAARADDYLFTVSWNAWVQFAPNDPTAFCASGGCSEDPSQWWVSGEHDFTQPSDVFTGVGIDLGNGAEVSLLADFSTIYTASDNENGFPGTDLGFGSYSVSAPVDTDPSPPPVSPPVPTPIPEPTSSALLLFGLLTVCFVSRRSRT